MSVKDNWKNTGKGLGASFKGLGKSIVKSVKVGVDKVANETPVDENGNPKPANLKESWSDVGRSFGGAGKNLGKAASSTAKKVVDKVDHAAEDESKDPEGSN